MSKNTKVPITNPLHTTISDSDESGQYNTCFVDTIQ